MLRLFFDGSTHLMAHAQKTAATSVMTSKRASADFALTADGRLRNGEVSKALLPNGAHVAISRRDIAPKHVLAGRKNLYFSSSVPGDIFARSRVCLQPRPNKPWDADVAEVFIGSDFQNIKHYYEFQVSPRGEWVDLFIDRNPDPPNHDVNWNSGFEVKAKIDNAERGWYGAMRIPIDKIDKRQRRRQ